jgi:hypothetical protein
MGDDCGFTLNFHTRAFHQRSLFNIIPELAAQPHQRLAVARGDASIGIHLHYRGPATSPQGNISHLQWEIRVTI